jgi:hypothetical protein
VVECIVIDTATNRRELRSFHHALYYGITSKVSLKSVVVQQLSSTFLLTLALVILFFDEAADDVGIGFLERPGDIVFLIKIL